MWRRAAFEFGSAREAKPLRVVGDAAIATVGVSEGRLVPLLIVDTAERPEVAELIRVHESLQPGDVHLQWGQRRRGDRTILLVLEFLRPIKLTAVIAFAIPEQSALVDLILQAKCFYLQVGSPGDRFLTTRDRPRLIIDVPLLGFEEVWDDLLSAETAAYLRGAGMGKSAAKSAAKEYLTQLRRLSAGRIRGGPGSDGQSNPE